jgi:tetrahydromethanopterin S-methyltransferase subunit G
VSDEVIMRLVRLESKVDGNGGKGVMQRLDDLEKREDEIHKRIGRRMKLEVCNSRQNGVIKSIKEIHNKLERMDKKRQWRIQTILQSAGMVAILLKLFGVF